MVKPNSRSRKSYYSASDDDEKSNPQFFKIFIPRHCSKHLRIPPAFIKYFKGVSPSKSILKTCAKTSWCIDVNKVGNYFFFQKGWLEFVRDNSLESGDFLIFCYTGNSEFYVPIFGKNNCRKEVPICTRDSDKLQPVHQGSGTVEASKSKAKIYVDSTVEIGTTRMPIQENSEAVGAPFEFGSKKAFFEAVLKPAYIYAGFLHIPSEFVKSYMSTHSQTARLNHSSKSWLVKLIRRGNSLVFSCGWGKFVADNTLKKGDVCSFELIGRNDYAFNVVIVRGNGTTPKKAQGTETTRPSSGREEGKSKAKIYVDSTVEIGTTRMPIQENIEAVGAPFKFGSKKAFFEAVLKPAYIYAGFLHIPLEFVKNYMSTHSQSARLNHSSKSWLVKLIRYGKGLVFSCGWRKFVADNTLKEGDVCSFELIGRNDYAFNVAIVRGNGTPNKAQGKSKDMEGLKSKEEGSKRRVEANIEDTSSKFISKHPFFQIVLSATYVSRSFMNIPWNFRKSHMSERRENAKLQLSNKWWVVNLKGYDCSRGYNFCGGWTKFVKENDLQVGDVCTFEMIEKEKYVFKVSIARGVNNGNPTEA